MATTTSASYNLAVCRAEISARDLAELTLGFGAIMAVLWLPTRDQLIFGPIALLAPLFLILLRWPGLSALGLDWHGVLPSLWILPAAVAVSTLGILVAERAGTFHALYQADLTHVGGYVLWTLYQQFLLQDYFIPRLSRMLASDAAIAISAVLFAVAHLPNLPLAVATLVWGEVSCALFRRYRSLYVLGLVQGLLGLCFAVCIPDSALHHMRVGLGYLRYRPM